MSTIRPIRIEGDIAYIPLTKGYEAIIDAADVPLVGRFNWYAKMKRNTVYATRADYSTGKPRKVYLHRVIMDAPQGIEVDHVSCDGLNNRRANLRLATPTQNMQNQRITTRNKSGLKGVSWDKERQKWRAQIRSSIKKTSLGRYDTPEAAHAAYCKASVDIHGEFWRTK